MSMQRRGMQRPAWGVALLQVLRIFEGLAAARQALALGASGADAEDDEEHSPIEEAPQSITPPPDEALREAARAALTAGKGVFAFPDSTSHSAHAHCQTRFVRSPG